ncbi:hypothetical protein B0H19DRAFT_429269 [Mycena capillaripes]|nr:hypothetical protein B0H19DRAFT_429269 [Mycena capillaripes]
MTSNFADCVKILPTTEEPPTGFLFLCPEEDFEIRPSSFCWPDSLAYWSLDPSGVERLGAEEATYFGFPSLKLATRIGVHSWDNSVYAGIREFQRAKGFDPESQDVARHLEYLLFYPFNEMDCPLAHVNEEEKYYPGEDAEDQVEEEDGQMDRDDDEDQMDLSW